jgi:hypothetical protein
MNCKHIRQKLVEYNEHVLDGPEQSQVEIHVQTCPTCAQELRDIKETIALLKSIPMEEPPESFWTDFSADVMNKVYATAPPVRRKMFWTLPRFRVAMGLLAVIFVIGGIVAYVYFQHPSVEQTIMFSGSELPSVAEEAGSSSVETPLQHIVSEDLTHEILDSEFALFGGTLLTTTFDVGYSDDMVDALLSGLTIEEKQALLTELYKIRERSE